MSRKIRRKKFTKQIDPNDLFEMLTEREEVPPTTLEERARIAEQLLETAKSLFKDNDMADPAGPPWNSPEES